MLLLLSGKNLDLQEKARLFFWMNGWWHALASHAVWKCLWHAYTASLPVKHVHLFEMNIRIVADCQRALDMLIEGCCSNLGLLAKFHKIVVKHYSSASLVVLAN